MQIISQKDNHTIRKPLFFKGFFFLFPDLSQVCRKYLLQKNTATYWVAVSSKALHNESDILALCSSKICT